MTLAGWAGLALAWLAATQALAAPVPEAPAAKAIAPMHYTSRVLDNGLTVIASRDPASANVSVQVWYRVGSRDDPRGRSGFAHLFEHMLFKATRNLVPEQFDRLTEDVGGFNNASTFDDYTSYYEQVPANNLQPILWAEAERMGSLVVDDAVFRSERDVVKEEWRESILAEPYGKLFGLYTSQASYAVHPYARPGIGSIEDLDAATVAEVRAFHAAYYRPDNAVLVVAGNFDPVRLDAWVDQYFAGIARPAWAIPRVHAREPARTGPRTYDVREPNTPLPAVVLTFQAPAAGDPDLAALAVLDAILDAGESSRLHQSLVYRQELASEVSSSISPSVDPGLITLAAIMAQGRTAEQGELALRAELARLRDRPVSAAELDEAQTGLVTDALRGRETAEGQAAELAHAAVVLGSPARADGLLEEIRRVTAADVQRVARKYLRDDRRVVIRYSNAGPNAATGSDSIATAGTVQAQPLDVAASEFSPVVVAPASQRVAPPAPGPARAIVVPAIDERVLANGLRVIVASNHALPLVSAQLRVMAGAAADPPGRAGSARLVAELLPKGARGRSATQIAHRVEAEGAQLSASAGWDSSGVTLNARRDRLESVFEVFADVVQSPTFAGSELQRQRQQALDELSVALLEPSTLAGIAGARLVYGAAPYGRMEGGSPKSLAALRIGELADFHRRWWRPDNAVLVITGDIDAAAGFALAERRFGGWRKPSSTLPLAPPGDGGATHASPRVVALDLPGSGQASVLVTRRSLSRGDPAFYPALVANSILGDGFSSRLNQQIRIRRGLSYGAGSRLGERLHAGALVATAQTRNESAAEVLALVLAEFRRMASTVPGDAELAARKAALVGEFGNSLESNEGLAGALADLAVLRLPLATLSSHVPAVMGVSAAQVQSAGTRLFDPAQSDIVLVGESKLFLPALKAAFPLVQSLPASAIDLDAAIPP